MSRRESEFWGSANPGSDRSYYQQVAHVMEEMRPALPPAGGGMLVWNGPVARRIVTLLAIPGRP